MRLVAPYMPRLTEYPLTGSSLNNQLADSSQQSHSGVCRRCVKGIKAKIYVDPEARPRFCKPRTVSFAFLEKVNKEPERLEKTGVIEPV